MDQDGFTENADALTYRLRVGFETGAFADTKFLIDFDPDLFRTGAADRWRELARMPTTREAA